MPGVSWRCWGGWVRRADRQGRSLVLVYVDLMTSANANASARVLFAGFDQVVRTTSSVTILITRICHTFSCY
jgi:hypothetical protein